MNKSIVFPVSLAIFLVFVIGLRTILKTNINQDLIHQLQSDVAQLRTESKSEIARVKAAILTSKLIWYFQDGGDSVSSEPGGKGIVVGLGLSSLTLLYWPTPGEETKELKFTFEYVTQSSQSFKNDLVLDGIIKARRIE